MYIHQSISFEYIPQNKIKTKSQLTGVELRDAAAKRKPNTPREETRLIHCFITQGYMGI